MTETFNSYLMQHVISMKFYVEILGKVFKIESGNCFVPEGSLLLNTLICTGFCFERYKQHRKIHTMFW